MDAAGFDIAVTFAGGFWCVVLTWDFAAFGGAFVVAAGAEARDGSACLLLRPLRAGAAGATDGANQTRVSKLVAVRRFKAPT